MLKLLFENLASMSHIKVTSFFYYNIILLKRCDLEIEDNNGILI